MVKAGRLAVACVYWGLGGEQVSCSRVMRGIAMRFQDDRMGDWMRHFPSRATGRVFGIPVKIARVGRSMGGAASLGVLGDRQQPHPSVAGGGSAVRAARCEEVFVYWPCCK